MKYKQEIHEYIESHKDEITEILKEIIKIPSVRGEAELGAPFGKACADALEHIKGLYEKNGFETELDTDGGYLLSYYGKGEKSLGLFAHADVVPVSDDWIYTKPFSPLVKDGFLIGRGASDDKSAVAISLYCAKILRELNIPFNSRLVMFTGANEESGMEDIRAYTKKHKAPDFSIVADTAFPLYRGDKGYLRFVATSGKKMQNISDFGGGASVNIILGEAKAKIGNEAYIEKGISRHGALPEGSLNAAFLLAKKLSENTSLCESDREEMRFIAHTLEKYYGEVFGIENTDSDFGRLTCTNGIAQMQDGKISLSFDLRYGKSVDIEAVKEKVIKYFAENGWSVELLDGLAPWIISKDNPYIKACLKAYEKITGKENLPTYVNAGATYGVYLPCAVEVGSQVWQTLTFDMPAGHGGAHQPDEYISIDGMLKALEITVKMLLECDSTM